VRIGTLRSRLGPDIATRFAGAMAIMPQHYETARRRRARLASAIAASVPPGTAIILPAVSVRYLERHGPRANLGEFYRKTLGLTSIAGHVGLPQVQLGTRPAGQPVGMSLLGAGHADRALLTLARHIEEQTE